MKSTCQLLYKSEKNENEMIPFIARVDGKLARMIVATAYIGSGDAKLSLALDQISSQSERLENVLVIEHRIGTKLIKHHAKDLGV